MRLRVAGQVPPNDRTKRASTEQLRGSPRPVVTSRGKCLRAGVKQVNRVAPPSLPRNCNTYLEEEVDVWLDQTTALLLAAAAIFAFFSF